MQFLLEGQYLCTRKRAYPELCITQREISTCTLPGSYILSLRLYFMQRCVECNNGGSSNCDTKDGSEDGLGVPDSDLIIYVSAVCTASNSGTLAFASSCEQENVLDRSVSHHYSYL